MSNLKDETNQILKETETYLMEIINEAIAAQADWSKPKLLAYDIDEHEQFLGIYSVQTPDGTKNIRFITNGISIKQGIEEL